MPEPLPQNCSNNKEITGGCCGARIWTKVIAWIEIISFGFSSLFAGYSIITLIGWSGDPKFWEEQDSSSGPADPHFVLTAVAIYCGVYFILSVLGFASGITLLVGANKMKPNLLHHWLIHTYIKLSLEGTVAIFVLCLASKGEVRAAAIGLAMLALQQSFSIWVVWTHKEEMENMYERMRDEIAANSP